MNGKVHHQALLAFAAAWLWGCAAVHAAGDAPALLKATGIRGGLCLVVGAKDPARAEALAKGSALYVQALQPDAKRALQWGRRFAVSPLRERLGARHAAFNAEDYGSDLFNLLVVENPAALGQARMADLERILVPRGVIVFRKTPPGFAATAKKLGMMGLSVPGFAAAFRKAEKTPEFRPTDMLKWRAGARYKRMAYWDFPGSAWGGGKMVYREKFDAPGGKMRFELICRDAYNGRTLWKIEEPPFTGAEWRKYLRRRMGIAVSGDGRVFTGLGRDFVCLDGENGKKIAVIAAGKRPGWIKIAGGKYLLANGVIYDLKTLRPTGKYPNGTLIVHGEAVYSVQMGKRVIATRLSDGKTLWSVAPTDQPKGQYFGAFGSDAAFYIRRGWPAASLSAMDYKTGKTLWTYPPPPRPKVRDVLAYPLGKKLYIAKADKKIAEPHDYVFREVDGYTGKVLRKNLYAPGKRWSGGCWSPRLAGHYLVDHLDTWLDMRTFKRTYMLLYRPKCSQGPLPANGLLYAFPGRKAGAIKGIAALAPRDIEYTKNPGGRILKRYGAAPAGGTLPRPEEWPIFRGNTARGNACAASPGSQLTVKWTARISSGGKTYGVMDAERTGVSQATVAGGLVYVADLDGQRIVCLDAETGKERWVFHAGSRVEFPPTIWKGLCLFGGEDGWVWCLDAKSGAPVYRLLAAPRERLIGGQEEIESMWPVCGDVLVADGRAFVSAGFASNVHGGVRVTAFDPRSGKTIWAKILSENPVRDNLRQRTPDHPHYSTGLLVHDAKTKRVCMSGVSFDPATGKMGRVPAHPGFLRGSSMEDWLSTNNLNRLSEDMGTASLSSGRGGIRGRIVAFGQGAGVGFRVARQGKSVFHVGKITMDGRSGQKKWSAPANDLNMDDFLVTKGALYCVGHYVHGKSGYELRVIAPADGSATKTYPLDHFPAYNGLSASGKKLFVATRDGRLICFEGK